MLNELTELEAYVAATDDGPRGAFDARAALRKLRDDARALWAVRVLDAWNRANWYDRATLAPRWNGARWVVSEGARIWFGPDPDAARLAAALAVLPELSDGARVKLGECP